MLDIAAPAKASAVAESPSKIPSKSKGLKPPTKIVPKAMGLKKAATEQVDTSGPAVSADEDPIGASLKARVAAGGLGN